MKRIVLGGLAILAGLGAGAAETSASGRGVDFAVACSNAYLKCVTAKDPTAYAVGEDVVFTVSLAGVTNAVPADAYSYKWTRTGTDGVSEEGVAQVVDRKPFVHTVKMDQAGAVRLAVSLVTKDGKPFEKVSGKMKVPLGVTGGALVAASELKGPEEPKDFAAQGKALKKRLPRSNFKKVVRTPVEVPKLKDAAAFAVDVPSPTTRPLKGLLVVPAAATASAPMPVTVRFAPGGSAPAAEAASVRSDEVLLVVACDLGKPETLNEEACADPYLEVLQALAFAKALPEWNGRTLKVVGTAGNPLPAVWAAAAGEGVTDLALASVPPPGEKLGFFDPLLQARHLADAAVTISRVNLALPAADLVRAAAFYQALPAAKSLVWQQGGATYAWEKLNAVRFVRMDAEHAKVEAGVPAPFKNVEEAFADKVVVEIAIDLARPQSLDFHHLSQIASYASRDLMPVVLYFTVPERKVKDKDWLKFREALAKEHQAIPFPIYVGAGMDLPPPDFLPWFNVTDRAGGLCYSGKELSGLESAYRRAVQAMGKADPVFAFARPELLKEAVEKLQKAKTPLPKLYKAIEAEAKKHARTDPARAKEARHLLVGMRQAAERRAQRLTVLFSERPGLAACQLKQLIADWPEAAVHPLVVALQKRMLANPDTEKLAKMEKDLLAFHAWQPTKASDVKKKDAQVAAFRKKLERLAKSANTAVQGEALLMQTELDNPPQPEEAQ